MNSVEISENLIAGICSAMDGKVCVLWNGGKESSVLWHMVTQITDADPVFIDTGLFPPETHQLLHDTFRKGNFAVKFYRNDDVLKAIHDSRIHRDEIQGDQRVNYDRMTNQPTVPFTLSNFAAKALLYDAPLESVMRDYDVVFRGDRKNRRQENYYLQFVARGGKALVVHPLLHWTEEDVWRYIIANNIPTNLRYRSGYRIVDSIEDPHPDGRPAWEQELGDGRETAQQSNPLMDRLVAMQFITPSVGSGSVDREKTEASYRLIADTLQRYANVAVAWSGHKDATVVAHLARMVRKEVPIVFIDTKYHFQETIQWRDLMSSLYGWNIITAKNDAHYDNPAKDVPDCCLHNKIMPLHKFIEDNRIDAILTGVREDDGRGNPAAVQEKVTRGGRPYRQVNPILDWNEKDVFTFLEVNNLPLNPLYRQGYRSIDCTYCTEKVQDPAKDERAGREHKNPYLVRLQEMGYF
jgi:phosphoadenosine phosphosulfate reductase